MPIPASFQTKHPEIHYWIMTNLETSRFARDVLERVANRGFITEREAWRIQHMIDCERRRANRQGGRKTYSAAAEAVIAMTRPFPPRD